MKDDEVPKSPLTRTPEVLKKKLDKVGILLASKNRTTDAKEIEKLKQKKEQYEQELEILLYPSESGHDENNNDEEEKKEKEEERHPKLIQKKLKKVDKMIAETNKDEDPKTYRKLQNKKKRYQDELDQFHNKLKDQAKANLRVHVVGAKKATSSLVYDMTGRSTSTETTPKIKPMPAVAENSKKAKTTKKVKTEAVAAKKIHSIPAGYQPPAYKKNAYESKLLKDALLKSFVFKSIHNNEKVMTQLVQAFQPTKAYKKGEIILKQGNSYTDNIDDADGLESGDGGQYFYIIRQGSVDYEVNGKYVSSGNVGQSFGELALLYDSPRAATVRASSSSQAGVSTGGGGNSTTKLWKVDQTTFRYVLMNRSLAIQKWKTAAKTIMAMNRIIGNIDTTNRCLDHLEKSLKTENRFNICESLAELPEDVTLAEDDNDFTLPSSNRGDNKLSSSTTSSSSRRRFSGASNDYLSEQFASWTQSSSTLQSLDTSEHERYATFLKEYADERTQMRNAFEDRDIGLDDLEQDAILGEGQFGQVWAVHCKGVADGDDKEEDYDYSRSLTSKNNDRNMIGEYALKIQSKNDEMREESSIDMIRRECQVLHDLIHPNIVEFVYSFEDEDNIYLVMSVIKGQELWEILHVEDPVTGDWYSGMSEDHARFYSFVMADTLNFMHKQRICYRDLKPENIMVSKVDGYPIYVDFGFAKYIPDGKTFTFCGTPNYASPELIQSEGHGFAADHWALGVVIYELICGDNPFYYDGISNLELLESITVSDPAPLGDDAYSSEVKDLIDKLLVKDPSKRLGSLKRRGHDIIRHPWFSSIDRQAVLRRELKAPVLPSATSN